MIIKHKDTGQNYKLHKIIICKFFTNWCDSTRAEFTKMGELLHFF